MAPSKRRKTSAASQPASGNATQGVRTRRSAIARSDLPDAPDADLEDEPEELLCPITRAVFQDPVMVVDSGHTYERSAILLHFTQRGQGPAHASLPEQHEGDDELGGETDRAGLAGQAPGRDARRVGQSRAPGAVEG